MKRGLALAAAALLVATALGGAAWRRDRMRSMLLASYADALPADGSLHAYAMSLARPAYAEHCASCHGAALQGNTRRGVPDLRYGTWIYDFGRVSDIERTVLYGIRSGNAKSRNTTDMPALGITHKLTGNQIADVAAYVFSLSHKGGDAAAVARGAAIYQGKGECFDCHGADASGNIDWGVPPLAGGARLYGDTVADITTSIHDGRHGRCPAWIGVLDPATIRALAVMLHDTASGKPQA